jgi:hypothetical protein
MIGEKESASCRVGLQALAQFLPEQIGKTNNATEGRCHTGQDWNCAPHDRHTKPSGL